MYSQRIRHVMERKKLLLAPPQTTVAEAARRMARRKVGAVMVVEGERLIGIFTERDAVVRVIARGRDTRTTPLAAVMTRDPLTLGPDERFGEALNLMHENGFRHLPILEAGRLVGIVSARNALDPELEEFVSEALRRSSLKQRKRRA